MKEVKVKYFNKEIDRLEKIAKGDWIDLRCAVPGGGYNQSRRR